MNVTCMWIYIDVDSYLRCGVTPALCEKRKHLKVMYVQALGYSEQQIMCNNSMVEVSTSTVICDLCTHGGLPIHQAWHERPEGLD